MLSGSFPEKIMFLKSVSFFGVIIGSIKNSIVVDDQSFALLTSPSSSLSTDYCVSSSILLTIELSGTTFPLLSRIGLLSKSVLMLNPIKFGWLSKELSS